MQGGRPPQPSGTNRPSSSACPSHGRSRGTFACARCAAPRARSGGTRRRNAPGRPAAMAGEAHPVPSRTRKLSPRAPIVLRVEPVGDQDAAGRPVAFSPAGGAPRRARGPSLFFGAPCLSSFEPGACVHLTASLHQSDTICLPFTRFLVQTIHINDSFRSPVSKWVVAGLAHHPQRASGRVRC